MKKFLYVFVIFSMLFLTGCIKNIVKSYNQKIKITYDIDEICVGDAHVAFHGECSKEGKIIFKSSDDEIAKMYSNGFLEAYKEGEVTISAYLQEDPSYTGSIKITVHKAKIRNIIVNGPKGGRVGDTLSMTYKYSSLAEETLSFQSEDDEIATVDKKGNITLHKIGSTNIIITTSGGYTQSFEIRAYDYSKIYVGDFNDTNDSITYDGHDYYKSYTWVFSLSHAMEIVDEGGTIYIVPKIVCDYNDSSINKNNVKIQCIAPDKRSIEENYHNCAKMTSNFVIEKNISGVEIRGFYFDISGSITLKGNNDNIIIEGNYFKNTNIKNTEWKSQTDKGLIYFNESDETSDNVIIANNYFMDAFIDCIVLNSVSNLIIQNNEFYNFKYDAIKYNNYYYIYEACDWYIANNNFNRGGYNAIYLPIIGVNDNSKQQFITIFDNKFENIGFDNTLKYEIPYGAISIDSYSGSPTCVNMRYNTFKNCARYVNIRNTIPKNEDSNLDVFANYNCFVIDEKVNEVLMLWRKEVQMPGAGTAMSQDVNAINAKDNIFIDSDNKILNASYYSRCTDISNTITFEQWNTSDRFFAKNVIYQGNTANLIFTNDGFSFQSSDPNILRINNNGNITALNPGEVSVIISKNDAVIGYYYFIVKPANN